MSGSDDSSFPDLPPDEEARVRAALEPSLSTDRTLLGDIKRIGPGLYRGYIIEHDDLVTHFEAAVDGSGEVSVTRESS